MKINNPKFTWGDSVKVLDSYLKKEIKGSASLIMATLRGEALGDDEFHQKIRKLISRPTKLTSHGGDRKSETYNQAG